MARFAPVGAGIAMNGRRDPFYFGCGTGAEYQ